MRLGGMSRRAAATYLRVEGELLTLTDVVRRLKISRWKVYDLMNAGSLPSIRIGRRRLVSADDLAAYVDRLREESRS
jgi:excisionase family DNA binding protein